MTPRWEDWPPAAPLRVDGGLTARSARGEIGATWWSKRFIAVLESFAVGGRLTRGKAYARKGQVLSLELAPGVVSGTVQGSRPTPYTVRISLPVLSADVWDRVEEAVSEQALFAAQLLGGQLPAELEEVFATAGASLFPASFGQLSMQCSCPDWGMPCKHLAATFYLLAETFDDDPFRILLWRGRSREQLLAALGARSDPTEEAVVDAPQPVTTGAQLTDLPAGDVEQMLDRFWVSPVPLPPRPPTLTVPTDLLLRQLAGPPAALGGAGLAAALQEAYRRMSQPDGVSPTAGDG